MKAKILKKEDLYLSQYDWFIYDNIEDMIEDKMWGDSNTDEWVAKGCPRLLLLERSFNDNPICTIRTKVYSDFAYGPIVVVINDNFNEAEIGNDFVYSNGLCFVNLHYYNIPLQTNSNKEQNIACFKRI